MTRLIYQGRLPRMNRQAPKWWHRSGLKRKCMKAWGVLPPSMRATTKMHVKVTRVLGPRERLMDEWENFRYAFKGGIDALVACGYLRDDSPTWATFEVVQDAGRRGDGPRVEIEICDSKT